MRAAVTVTHCHSRLITNTGTAFLKGRDSDSGHTFSSPHISPWHSAHPIPRKKEKAKCFVFSLNITFTVLHSPAELREKVQIFDSFMEQNKEKCENGEI